MRDIQENLLAIKKQIAEYEHKYHRQAGSVQLLAVSKDQPVEKILAAIEAGQQRFGENYLQEALPKIAALHDKPIEWHFIGRIQSNKTKKIAEHFAWVHSVQNENSAKRLSDQRPASMPPLNICLEINIGNEKAKGGISADKLISLAEYCLTLPHIKLRGLMAIPAIQKDLAQQRAEFHKLLCLYQTVQRHSIPLDTLSMGMSDDFEAAIAEESTLVRIGSAIFGPRRRL